MSLKKPSHKRIAITIAELLKAKKNKNGVYITKKGSSKTITVYNISTEEVYNIIRKLFEK